MTTQTATGVGERIADLDWTALAARLDEDGFVQTPPVYTAGECRELAAAHDGARAPPMAPAPFRQRMNIPRSRWGRAEQMPLAPPPPEPTEQARRAFCPP